MKSWTQWKTPQRNCLPPELRDWLVDTGSLTKRLQQNIGQDFSVDLLSCHWEHPCPDEALLLGQNIKQLAYQREVHLNDGDLPAVYARTVVPLTTYQAMRYRFDTLGNRSLGEMLFNEPSLQRGSIEVACIKPGQYLYESACQHLSFLPEKLWGRRSCFYIDGKRLLVNEIFLPSRLWSN